jgi:hypothetical protein
MVVRIFIQMIFDQAKGGSRFQERRVFVATYFVRFTRGKARAGKELIQKRIEHGPSTTQCIKPTLCNHSGSNQASEQLR